MTAAAGDRNQDLPRCGNAPIRPRTKYDDVRIDGQDFKVDEIAGLLRAIRAKDVAKTNMSVILRGDRKMTYTDLSDFMKACAKAGVIDVTFATLEAGTESP